MNHQPRKRRRDWTAADHRPMIPVYRRPVDPLDEAVRGGRRTDCLLDPKEYLYWR